MQYADDRGPFFDQNSFLTTNVFFSRAQGVNVSSHLETSERADMLAYVTLVDNVFSSAEVRRGAICDLNKFAIRLPRPRPQPQPRPMRTRVLGRGCVRHALLMNVNICSVIFVNVISNVAPCPLPSCTFRGSIPTRITK